MKKLLCVLMLPLLLITCKKDDPEPEPEIASIVGKWRHIAYETTVDGEKVWVPAEPQIQTITFRYDGLILGSDGLPPCCRPKSYHVNGVFFKVIPKTTVPGNAQCAFVDCIGCETWDIEQAGNDLIITLCEPTSSRSKYIRE